MATATDQAAIAERMLEVKQEIGEKAAQDSTFRAALLSDPASTIEKEYGLESGALKDVQLNVVEEPAGSIVIPIPPDISEMELTDEQLDQVAGGVAFIAAVGVGVSLAVGAATVVQNTREGRSW